MKELKIDELQEINGGLGGGPSYNHPKPNKRIAKCIASVGLGAAAGWGNPWTMAAGGLGALINC